jgi:predicted metal-dependent hydrolase
VNSPIIALVEDEDLRRPIQELAANLHCDVIWSLDVKGVVSRVANLRPAVILIELSHEPHHWHDIVRALKSNPATRRIAILGFSVNLTSELREKATSVIFDDVFAAKDSPDDVLLSTLESRVKSYARRTDADIQQALKQTCLEPMPRLVYQGIQEFNRGNYYEAHEDLEHAWMDETHVVRNLYQGILQVGVAYYQIQRSNYWGAIKMFLRGFQWLEAMPNVCHGVDVAKLRQDARHAWQALETLGPGRIDEFDQSLFQPINFDETFVVEE